MRYFTRPGAEVRLGQAGDTTSLLRFMDTYVIGLILSENAPAPATPPRPHAPPVSPAQLTAYSVQKIQYAAKQYGYSAVAFERAITSAAARHGVNPNVLVFCIVNVFTNTRNRCIVRYAPSSRSQTGPFGVGA